MKKWLLMTRQGLGRVAIPEKRLQDALISLNYMISEESFQAFNEVCVFYSFHSSHVFFTYFTLLISYHIYSFHFIFRFLFCFIYTFVIIFICFLFYLYIYYYIYTFLIIFIYLFRCSLNKK